MSERDGGPAFPTNVQGANHLSAEDKGMSLRDYFAGQALSGLLSGYMPYQQSPTGNDNQSYIETAYVLADAMLAERAKRQEPSS